MDIKINIEKQKLYLKKEPHEGPYIVSDSINYLQCIFKFSEDWTDFIKTAIFKDDIGNAYSILMENDKCFVPYEVLSGNNFKVSVFGSKDGVRITTNEVVVPIVPSGYTEGKTPSKPPKTAYELILDKLRQIGTLVRLQTNNKETLVEAINEVASYAFTETNQSSLETLKKEIGNVENLKVNKDLGFISDIATAVNINYDSIKTHFDMVSTEISGVQEDISNLNTQMGDIDTALDNIIAIQNSYIGGDSV